MIFPEFMEFTESSAPLRNNSIDTQVMNLSNQKSLMKYKE